MARSLNLILAIVWLTLGVGLLTVYGMDPEALGAWEYRAVPGLFSLGMAAYNLIRWWSIRNRRRKADVDWDAFRRPHSEPPTDSAFELTDRPPPIRQPPGGHIKSADDPHAHS